MTWYDFSVWAGFQVMVLNSAEPDGDVRFGDF